ncbi:MAG: helicase, partial [Planctomycetaceae bacterium]|nr:helicase [Planctomycetaceae bacterium]
MCPDLGKANAKWNDVRVLLFTEYEDTKRYLLQQLESAIAGSDRADSRIEVFHGPTPPPKRDAIKRAFNKDPSKHPVRILVATDAAREGLNLQAHCYNLFHFDVPWNPSRMEQRNGRIDRKLQPSPDVYCHYFVYKQRPEDRILQVLVRKTEKIKEELGSLSEVIDARLSESLSEGIRRDSVESLEAEIENAELDAERQAAIADELESTRERQVEIREQIDRLRTQLQKSRDSIGLKESHFRSAISCSLSLMGSDTLSPVETDEKVPRFKFPALDERSGADPTWAETMDTLREPRKKDQRLWDWRKESPIRPIVFNDPGTLDDDVVHMHLEQRVVQRLLGRFMSQGFVHHDLSRACFAQATDSIPRVVLLGRLCLYGAGAARLHEELIPITAKWVDPKIRDNPLSPYAKDTEVKTMGLLEDSLLKGHGTKLSAEVTEQLRESAPHDISDLLQHLEARGEEYAADAIEKLTARGEAEAKAMTEILETQRKRIENEIRYYKKSSEQQLLFEFDGNEDELQQLSANKRYWAKRLTELRDELKTEPERIRNVYSV